MRLEPFCRVWMRYRTSSWHRPFEGEEGLGFGQGDGTVSGELEGALVWANYPRRREDGVWTPNVRGTVTTSAGEDLLLSIHGQSVEENAPGERRAILARVELTSDAERWRWLNTCFLVGEGEIDEKREDWWLDTFVCVNELAQGQPALGVEPPERFRQRGASA
jgi:hypothetical protein